jgi:hypothetical protein
VALDGVAQQLGEIEDSKIDKLTDLARRSSIVTGRATHDSSTAIQEVGGVPLVLDASALIAFERSDATIRAFLERTHRRDDPVRTSTGGGVARCCLLAAVLLFMRRGRV